MMAQRLTPALSPKWMRFLTTEMEIRHQLHRFLLDRRWAAHPAPRPDRRPGGVTAGPHILRVSGVLDGRTVQGEIALMAAEGRMQEASLTLA
jgi:hypothetical protein